jgi:FkbM family methyltransferase
MILAGGVWSVMQTLKVDELIVSRTPYSSFLRKVIPRSRAYKPEQFEYDVAPNLKLVLDRHDYSQWRIFSGRLRINPRIFEYFTVNPFSFTMYDVGANVGGFAALFSNEIDVGQFHIHSFEPNPLVYPSLEENMSRLSRANLSAFVYVNNVALGDKSGKMTLRLNENHSGISTLGKTKHSYTKTQQVRVIPLDLYTTEANPEHLDLIKIDAEAYEPAVLKGALETIDMYKPSLYFEYSKDWFDNFNDDYLTDLFKKLTAMGYIFLREGRDGKMNYFVLNTLTLREYNHLNILGIRKIY